MNQESPKYAREKIEARAKLLNLPPQTAQNLVNQTLYPKLWHFDISNHSWEESIPTKYGETDT